MTLLDKIPMVQTPLPELLSCLRRHFVNNIAGLTGLLTECGNDGRFRRGVSRFMSSRPKQSINFGSMRCGDGLRASQM